MTTTGVTLAGQRVLSAKIYVPSRGVWWADCVMESDPSILGLVNLVVSPSMTMSGFAAVDTAGAFANQRRVRVVGGAGGWSTMIARKAYHADNGVSSTRVINDAASDCGESVNGFTSTHLGKDFVRVAGIASSALDNAVGDSSWWVEYDGTTTIGARSTSTPTAGSFTLIEYDPITRDAVLAMDDLSSIVIGSQISDPRVDSTLTVCELRFEIEGADATVVASCGVLDTRGRIASALVSIARKALDDRFYAPLRYRVVRMSGDRVELQAVSPGAPDIGPISMSPGVAGAHSELAPGTIAIVTFVEGLRTMPIITHFVGKDGNAFVPVNTTVDITSLLKLGANASQFVALAPSIDSQFDAINQALDAFALAVAVPNDGGAAIQAAFKALWSGVPPAPPSDVGASKVKAE